MPNDIYKTLNTLIKGEEMAVDLYGKFMSEISDSNIRTRLQAIRESHARHMSAFSERLVALGGTPEFGNGFPGAMARTIQAVKSLSERSDCEVLDEICSGERLGITAFENTLREPLDQSSLDMANAILTEDRTHISVLDELKNSCSAVNLQD